ncbi:SRPBCC family protein [Salinibacter altiplanensis]|uniref:SRPBCC family protein n=1 Tax=Salinibacter altiplanensis TaxID=1803181 RepID=UPI000C9FEFCF|nr:SRPBCC family protein [Salinibacter altiplanensis]
MVNVREHIDLSTPVDRVFDFMDAPAHQAAVTPSLSESTLLERLPNGGARARYTYRILGLSFSGEVRATDYVPGERIVWSMTGDLQGTIRWYFESIDGGCRLTYAATYQVPGPRLLHPLAQPFIRRYNEREVHALLHNLETRVAS